MSNDPSPGAIEALKDLAVMASLSAHAAPTPADIFVMRAKLWATQHGPRPDQFAAAVHDALAVLVVRAVNIIMGARTDRSSTAIRALSMRMVASEIMRRAQALEDGRENLDHEW